MIEEIVVMSALPTPKARKHILQRVAVSQCLCCPNPMLKRGLCYQCYYKWRIRRMGLPGATKKAAYDSKLIRCGRLLSQQSIREFKNQSVFDDVASEVS